MKNPLSKPWFSSSIMVFCILLNVCGTVWNLTHGSGYADYVLGGMSCAASTFCIWAFCRVLSLRRKMKKLDIQIRQDFEVVRREFFEKRNQRKDLN